MADGADHEVSKDLTPAAEGRRRLLGLVAGAAVGISVLPASWTAPVVGTIVVPAHAQVSPVSASVSASTVGPTPTPTVGVGVSVSRSAAVTPAPTPGVSVSVSRSATVTPTPTASELVFASVSSSMEVTQSVSASVGMASPDRGRRPSD